MGVMVLPPSRLLSISDGDTPVVGLPVRLLGIDAPELHFPGGRDVAKSDSLLASLPKKAAFKKLPESLRAYLLPRLEDAGSRQKEWGLKALEGFKSISGGVPRKAGPSSGRAGEARPPFFLASGAEVFDRYGRMLVRRAKLQS